MNQSKFVCVFEKVISYIKIYKVRSIIFSAQLRNTLFTKAFSTINGVVKTLSKKWQKYSAYLTRQTSTSRINIMYLDTTNSCLIDI
jgi:hypothetical protein